MTAPADPVAVGPSRPEIWLRTNVRALLVGLALVLFLLLSGLSAIAIAGRFQVGLWLELGGWIVVVICGFVACSLTYQLFLPRLAYHDGHLLVYLQSSEPLRVPIDVVEFFFVGQGTSYVPDTTEGPSKSRTIVVRIAEAATEWHDLPIRTAQGEWRESYILLRGTWSERITPDVVKRLNRRLVEVQRSRRQTQEPSA